ncbi:MAG: ParA family protein [Candidatus Anammoximicrobium sp.]|nr:ParA family protein [Candidatus Anammoximicrobium sp.]
MRTIAIINQKGGVGKTTTAVNLSAALAEQGQRVCLIDLDPQAHASLHLGAALREDRGSVYQVLTGDTRLSEVRVQIAERLWLVPSHLDLAAAELELAGEVGRELILRDKLMLDDGDFDYLIIDCPPSLGVLTLNALTAVKEIFLPLQPHFLALHGFGKLLRTVDVVAQRLNPGLRLAGVVLCMYESGTRLAAEVSSDVEAFLAQQQSATAVWAGAKSFATRIRRNIRLAEAPSFGQTIFQYAPDSNGARDYRRLAREVLGLPLEDDTDPPRRSRPAASIETVEASLL